jgi:archaellum component FlaC
MGEGMGDQGRSEKDFEALMALLTDIEKELGPEGGDKSRIRELYEYCMRELALLKKNKVNTDRDIICL